MTIGQAAPNFKAPNPDGKLVSLKENLGKVTLIDFWASWCAPCRAENPNVVALYSEFHSKGFNIISVSLDNDGKKWKQAIATDKLIWSQVSNLKEMQDPIALQYGISQIPTTFLLDATGKIVAIDLNGEALKSKIKELLEIQ
ncbi:TlpA disulfide reductase family protein [Flavobacterium sp.]|uniref:TlpA family protein disulfide reductase n=1 Tax=Flavobacterium sp. TaxID=239 RepID=UPI00342FA7EB